MSKPANALASLSSYEPKHILLAFDNAVAACDYVMPKSGLGKCGSPVDKIKCGNAIVVVNELEDMSYKIINLEWSFDFFSPTTANTTISAGYLTVADSRGNQFPSFMRRISKKLGMPKTRLTFLLVTVFRGRNKDNDIVSYSTNPVIFSMSDLSTGFKDGQPNQYIANFTLLYNTKAQFPTYTRLNQFTITNKENDPSKSVPIADGGKAVILSRAREDAINNIKRANRIKKSAPMRNLREVFEGFESELKEMRFENKRQLQEFISILRPDAVKKIKTPKAKHVKAGSALPIDFKVNLDSAYHNYPVDNRNLMTEQIETRQMSAGISSLTIPPGSDVFKVIDVIMKLSTRTADDVSKGYTFKTVASIVDDCEGISTITINVMRYKIPVNTQDVKDTGPDEKGNVDTLELEYMSGTTGMDVISLRLAASPKNIVSVLEENSDEMKNDAVFSSSQREQITFERPENSGFSGNRPPSSPLNFGLQDAISAATIDASKHRYALAQNTLTIVDIVGNPDLYSDLARNPKLVASMQSMGAKLYKFPEYYPMYIKLKVVIANSTNNGASGDDENHWFHTYHYHLAGVTNSFFGGQFVQTLRLLSTDNTI